MPLPPTSDTAGCRGGGGGGDGVVVVEAIANEAAIVTLQPMVRTHREPTSRS